MPDLSDFDQVVSEFMQDMGSTATLIIAGPTVRNLDTGDAVATTVEYTVNAILLDLTLQSNGLTTVNGKMIESGDKRAFIQPLNKSDPSLSMPSVNPDKDKFRMAGINYTIITLKETNPSTDNSVMLELYLRR